MEEGSAPYRYCKCVKFFVIRSNPEFAISMSSDSYFIAFGSESFGIFEVEFLATTPKIRAIEEADFFQILEFSIMKDVLYIFVFF